MRVLVVDDDPRLRSLLRRHLERSGAEVLEAEDGAGAWRLLRDAGAPVLITDLDMPVLDGFELVERVRGLRSESYTYVIALTGLSDGDTLRRCMQVGVDDFLRKPFSPHELEARLQVATRITDLQAELAARNRDLEASNRRLRRVHERIATELEAAARVQRALLPADDLRVPGLRLGWQVRPGEELAGDVLNVLRLDERTVALYVLDVSGHGVPAALLSAQLSRLMSPMMTQSQLLKRRLDAPPWYRVAEPLEVVRQLNSLFPLDPRAPQFFTLVYGVLDLDDGSLTLVTAAQPGPLLVPVDGAVRDLTCPGNPIGLLPKGAWTQQRLRMARGDRLMIYSDGLTEAHDARREPFGDERLRLLAEEVREQPPEDACAAVMDAVDRWCGGQAAEDDRSLLVVDVE